MTLALAVSTCSVLARAQDAANTFEQLHARVKPGDMVIVTDAEGRDVRGRITVLSPSSLAIDVDGRTSEWIQGDVRLIRHRKPDSLVNGTLIGLGVGAGVGVGLGIGVATTELYYGASGDSDATVVVILGAALGAATGLAIDAARRDDVVVFRAGGATTASLRLMPLVTPRAQGIRVAVVF